MFSTFTTRFHTALLLLLSLGMVVVTTSRVTAQITTGTLTGTVADSSGAVIPHANITLTNEASGDIRRVVSNSEGFFTFSSIPPATYSVDIESKGFEKWHKGGIGFNNGDKRNLSDIALVIGSATDTVTVASAADEITPVDSGEKASVIGQKQLQNVAIVGRNAAEFIKILPGFAIIGGGGGLVNNAYTGENSGTGSGPIGSFSANGQRTGALDMTVDGAHVIDPGCNCGQAVNANTDMTQEVKVMTSNFGAENQKGPIVIAAVGKSGGKDFHGEAYI
ncbi:MAG TPA: carboxypeptidase regulatory-like domain-containing protein, partial [Solibacterales bacterium]|nr:carboxypeptidase regulatory-like domain-containing protein [Bryobacterales bacterium]